MTQLLNMVILKYGPCLYLLNRPEMTLNVIQLTLTRVLYFSLNEQYCSYLASNPRQMYC